MILGFRDPRKNALGLLENHAMLPAKHIMNPDVISGREQSICLLFAMNILFEEYIAIELKKAVADKYDVLAQKPQKKLLNNIDGQKLFLRGIRSGSVYHWVSRPREVRAIRSARGNH